MNDVYLDSSLLVKLYRNEPDSPKARQTLGLVQGEAIVSQLSDVEVLSVLQRTLSLTEAAVATAKYKAQRASGLYGFADFDTSVLVRAVSIAEQIAKAYSLQSLDILHLATTLTHGIPAIASFDSDLRKAAVALGLAVLPA